MKLGKIKFSQDKLNICQVSLKENIPIIIENYLRFKSFYKDLNIFVICPKGEISSFRKKLRFNEFIIVSEEQIISSYRFKKIFFKLSKKYQYKNLFKERLSWYYQQILKLSFIFYFSKKFKKKIILWDADTIITKKIKFFDGDFSVKFGTFVEFHKSYFEINKELLKKIPKYFISSVIQFGTWFRFILHLRCDFYFIFAVIQFCCFHFQRFTLSIASTASRPIESLKICNFLLGILA